MSIHRATVRKGSANIALSLSVWVSPFILQQDLALSWDDHEVARRWIKLFNGKPLVRSFVAGEKLSVAQLKTVSSLVECAADFGRSFLKGQAAAAALFSPG